MDNMENKVDYTVYRQDVENMAGRPLTDKEWEVMASEIEGMLNHYFFNDTPLLLEDIDYLVEQDSKYD